MDAAAIRNATVADDTALAALYVAAFPSEDLLPLVRRLTAEVPDCLSLVAAAGETVAGHVLFTPCRAGDGGEPVALLGPLAVVPPWQRKGIGRALIGAGVDRLRGASRRILVLGDPAYYGRFGFRPEARIAAPYDLPAEWAEAWQSLSPDGDDGPAIAGRLQPPSAWMSSSLWQP